MKPALILSLLLLACPALAQYPDIPTVDLRDITPETEGLPYLLVPKPEFRTMDSGGGRRFGLSQILADFDQDGKLESLRSGWNNCVQQKLGPDGQLHIFSQFNYPRKFWRNSKTGPRFAFFGPFDIDGDGRLEVASWGPTPDRKETGFWLIDPLTMEETHHFTLFAQPQRKADGVWDGSYSVIGTVPGLLDNPRHQALILTVSVGHDAYGRGIMAIDPFTGDILWHHVCGPDPYFSKSFVTDLDLDGEREIVFLGRGPDNLDGELIGQYSDNETRLFVLDTHGQEKWSRKLEDGLSTSEVALGNLDTDPQLEIVTASRIVGEAQGQLRAFSADGHLIAETSYPSSTQDIALINDRLGAPLELAFCTSSGHLVRAGLDGDRWQFKRRALYPSHVRLRKACQLDPQQAPLLLTTDRTGRALLITPHFEPVAVASDDQMALSDFFMELPSPTGPILLRLGTGPHGYLVTPNPHALPSNALLRFLVTLPFLGWVLIAVILGGLVFWWSIHRRHRGEIRARAVIPGDDKNLREAHLHLLEDLELSGHGAIAPLRSLRRLIWLLDALKTGIDFNGEIGARFREIWQDCHQEDLPRLLVILDRARAAELNHPSIDIATTALQKAQHMLSGFKKADFDVTRMEAASTELHELSDAAETALQDLRCEVSGLFKADIQKVVARVLRANRPEIEAAGITVQAGMMAAAAAGGTEPTILAEVEDPACRMDPSELGFILDNLVGNAVRAMGGSQTRQLRISWLATTGLIKLEVSDTGVGIAHEDLDRILESPFSTREGGGLGLPKSVRLLRKYGGTLSIKSSSPGRGTTFQMLVPRTQD